MRKHELKKIVLGAFIAFCLPLSTFGTSFSSNDILGGSNSMPFEVECTSDVDLSFPNLNDICSSYKNIEKGAGSFLNKLTDGFSFSGCKIAKSESTSCRNAQIRKMCSQLLNLNGKTLFGSNVSNVKSKENMLWSGGDVYMKGMNGNICSVDSDMGKIIKEKIKYGNMTNEAVESEYFSPKSIQGKTETGGQTAFFKPAKLNLYETCIKNNLNNGISNPEAKCSGEFYSLPESRIAVDEQVANSVNNMLKDSTSGMNKKINNFEQTIKESDYTNCSNGTSSNCTDTLYVNKKERLTGMVALEKEERIKKTEEEMASYQEHVRVATMPKYQITYPTQEVLNGLHPDKKEDFVALANQQMHQKALFNSSIQNLSNLKKELIEISFQKVDINSRTFYSQIALNEAKSIMNNGLSSSSASTGNSTIDDVVNAIK